MSFTKDFGQTAFARSYESLVGAPPEDVMSLIEVKTAQAITLGGIKRRLEDDEVLNVKFGTDPTGPDLHIGHIAPIRVLDVFRRAGHNVDLIFGDFTAKVGDPSGRSSERKVLDDAQIADNMSTFRDQVNRYFDTNRDNVRVHANSSWLGRMTLTDVFGFLQEINLTEAVQRNDFRERMSNGHAVSLAEAVYGTLMGIDSVQLRTDIEVGGIDQLLNFQQTRAVQRARGQRAEDIIMTPLLEGTSGDGRKMSKSYGNYVPVRADIDEIFGKIMSIPDTLIVPYAKTFAPIYKQEIGRLGEVSKTEPLETKKQLATYMAALSVSDYDKGLEARERFERQFGRKEVDPNLARELQVSGSPLISDLEGSGDFKSRSDIRRIAEQGGVKLNGERISTDDLFSVRLSAGDIVSVGKRKLYRATEGAE